VSLQFRLIDPRTGRPIPDVKDLHALAFLAPGIWQARQIARETSPGVYSIELVPPRPGIYYVYFSSESLSLKSNNDQYFVLEARSEHSGG